MRKQFALNILAGTAFCGALAMSVAAVRLHLKARNGTVVGVAEGARQADWRNYAATGRVIGPPAAPATVTVFSDFQCPFCARLADELKELRARHPGQIRIVFRHTPLPIHPFAAQAAAMSECAGVQGRFEEMHNLLFADQGWIGKRPPSKWIRPAGVPDSAAFAACMKDTAWVLTRLRRDGKAAMELAAIGTPLVLVNDHRFDGTPDVSTLEKLVQDAILARAQ